MVLNSVFAFPVVIQESFPTVYENSSYLLTRTFTDAASISWNVSVEAFVTERNRPLLAREQSLDHQNCNLVKMTPVVPS